MTADSHAHYTDSAFDGICDTVVSESLAACGIIVGSGYDTDSSFAALALADRYDGMYASVGIHPQYDGDVSVIEHLCATRTAAKIVAVGEIGLDYRNADDAERSRQRDMFVSQIEIAEEYDLPIVIHCVKAWGDMTEILRRYRPKGIMHGFTGSAETAEELLRLGMYISFGGRLTYPDARKAHRALCAVPDDRLLLETDAPYGAPAGHEGPSCGTMLYDTAAFAAMLRGTRTEDLTARINENTARIYGI